jgi:probable rRNA maturation factor
VITLEIEEEDPRWAAIPERDRLFGEAGNAALAVAPATVSGDVTATVLLTDDETVRELNAAWRNQNKPTNVLSFPSPPDLPMDGDVRCLGDMVLAFETVEREASEQGKSLADHATHLVVHSVLHLCGLGHETDMEADEMEGLETRALARLGIADPYRPIA